MSGIFQIYGFLNLSSKFHPLLYSNKTVSNILWKNIDKNGINGLGQCFAVFFSSS